MQIKESMIIMQVNEPSILALLKKRQTLKQLVFRLTIKDW